MWDKGILRQRRAKVIKLRKQGKKWDEVAKELGVGVSTAKQYGARKWFKKGIEDKEVPEAKSDDVQKENKVTPGQEAGKETSLEAEEKKESQSKVVGRAKQKTGIGISGWDLDTNVGKQHHSSYNQVTNLSSYSKALKTAFVTIQKLTNPTKVIC